MYNHQTTTQDARSDVYVSVDIANVGALWARDPDLTWEALNQLEGLLETMAEDMGGTIIDADDFIDVSKSHCNNCAYGFFLVVHRHACNDSRRLTPSLHAMNSIVDDI